MGGLNIEEVPRPELVPLDTRLQTKIFNVGTRKSALALAQAETCRPSSQEGMAEPWVSDTRP